MKLELCWDEILRDGGIMKAVVMSQIYAALSNVSITTRTANILYLHIQISGLAI